MKKISGIALILFLLFSTTALAGLGSGYLNIAFYNESTQEEVIYDLGKIGVDFNLTDTNVLLGNISSIGSYEKFGVYAADIDFNTFYGYDGLVGSIGEPGIDGSPYVSSSAFLSAQVLINATYDSGEVHEIGYVSDPNSYYVLMGDDYDFWGDPGVGAIDIPLEGSLEIGLWYYGVTDWVSYELLVQARLTVFANGDIVLNAPSAENSDPVISSIDATNQIIEENQTQTLTASAEDPDGDPLTYSWSNDFNTETLTGNPVVFTAPEVDRDETITYTLTVSDGKGGIATDTIAITVTDILWPPAGVSIQATPGTLSAAGGPVELMAQIDGWDPEDEDLVWSWSTTYAGLNITNADMRNAGFTAPANTGDTAIIIPIDLQVSHSRYTGSADATTVNVTVNPTAAENHDPENVVAGASPLSVTAGESITLTAEAADQDGDTLYYTWTSSIDDGWSPAEAAFNGDTTAGVSATIDYQTDGQITSQQTIVFTLSVTDKQGGVPQTAQIQVTVFPAGQAISVVAFAGDDQCVMWGDTATLDGSSSTGEGLSYQWTYETQDIPIENFINTDQAVATFTVPEGSIPTTHLTFSLTVTDAEGKTSTDECSFVTGYSTEMCTYMPDADAGEDQNVFENQLVQLTGSGVHEQQEDVTTYTWIQTQGPPVQLAGADTAVPTFTAPVISGDQEVLEFKLTLTDTFWDFETTDTVLITVNKEEENIPPTKPVYALSPIIDGVWEASVLNPSLIIQNSMDDNGDELTYDFEIYAYDPEIIDPEEITVPANLVAETSGVEEGENTTSWETPILDENNYYWWRARAWDGSDYGDWPDSLSLIFVNAQEEPPGVPEIISPVSQSGCANVAEAKLTVANTTDPDNDQLTYEFRLYDNLEDPLYEYIAVEEVVEGTGAENTTETIFDTGLTEDQPYYWRVRAKDEASEGEWSDIACFYFSSTNDPPNPPEVTYPKEEIDTAQPEFLIEGGLDPEGGTVYFTIFLYGESFESEDLIYTSDPIIKSDDDPATAWLLPETVALEENTTYRYQVIAGDEEGAESECLGSFFVNQANEPPYTLAVESPTQDSVVTTLTPTLVAISENPADPDLDSVTYIMELFLVGDLTDPIESSDNLDDPQWTVPAGVLNNNKKYYWRVRAVDEHEETGEWTAFTSFTTDADLNQPTTPVIVWPFDGGTVNTLTPTLSVVAEDDGDGDEIWVEFEIYLDNDLSEFVSYGIITLGDTATSWTVDIDLTDQTEYFWRVRAYDGTSYSSWSTVACFTVDQNGTQSYQVHVWEVGYFDPTVPWETVIEVNDKGSLIHGVRLTLQPGSLATHESLYIGTVNGAPSGGGNILPIGSTIFLGPTGTVFINPVELTIPFSDDDLMIVDGIQADDLKIVRFDEASQLWKTLDAGACEVDAVQQQITCWIDHFSMYSMAVDAAGTDGSDDGDDGGGGGGCFIGTATESFVFTSVWCFVAPAIFGLGLPAIFLKWVHNTKIYRDQTNP